MATSHHLFPQSRPEKDGEEGAGKGEKQRKEKSAKGERAFYRTTRGALALTAYDATPPAIMALRPSLSEFLLGFSSFSLPARRLPPPSSRSTSFIFIPLR
jgi:hypothetical protein